MFKKAIFGALTAAAVMTSAVLPATAAEVEVNVRTWFIGEVFEGSFTIDVADKHNETQIVDAITEYLEADSVNSNIQQDEDTRSGDVIVTFNRNDSAFTYEAYVDINHD